MTSRILIVDDEESIRFTFKTFLSKEGHAVLTAKDYETALEIISQDDLDLIFADILLSAGRTGVDILREVNRRRLASPVIMITGEPNIETSAEAVREGAFDYLPKPIHKETLLQVTRRALRHKALVVAKEKLEAEKDKYRRNLDAIFRSLKDAIITVDHNMRIIEANEATHAICGFSPQEIIGKTFAELPRYCHGSCQDVLKETLQEKRSIKDYCVKCRHHDRPDQVVQLSSSPLTDRANNFIGAVLVVRDITRLNDLERELKERQQFHNIVGKSQKMQKIYRLLEDLADTETSVLITGASGTGKELVARALHYGGLRTAKPLVTVNCSALAENLLESELFGHVRGAFTDAVKDKVGRFQLADGGTLFLDEVGDISPRIQLKLLRVLQEKEFERVGDSIPVTVDVRVIAATNRDLREKVRRGEFREDLYYRLKVIEIALPPLAERREDIPLLVDHFQSRFKKKLNKNIENVAAEVLAAFMRYPWPGNVRELEHAIEHAFVLCRDRTLLVDHLPPEIEEYAATKARQPVKATVDERQEILQALNQTDWNKAKAARLLGI
ncbi:MAG: sigma 54-interacting transcriptional regulator, partial [Desulfobacterales bacterium]